jgi:hypothetical protein
VENQLRQWRRHSGGAGCAGAEQFVAGRLHRVRCPAGLAAANRAACLKGMFEEITSRATPRRRKRRWLLLTAAIFVVFGSTAWLLLSRQNFKEFVAREVKSGVPLGTTRAVAKAWCVRTLRFIPTYNTPQEVAQWKTGFMKSAGVPTIVPGGVIQGLVKSQNALYQAYDLIRPQHVWYFLLLDERGEVYDYRFMSFNDLREIERRR